MAAIVEEFSNSLFEDPGGRLIAAAVGTAAEAAAVQSVRRRPTPLVLAESASSSMDVLPAEALLHLAGGCRASRTSKQGGGVKISSSSPSQVAGDNSRWVDDLMEVAQQRQQQQHLKVPKLLHRSQATFSSSGRAGR